MALQEEQSPSFQEGLQKQNKIQHSILHVFCPLPDQKGTVVVSWLLTVHLAFDFSAHPTVPAARDTPHLNLCRGEVEDQLCTNLPVMTEYKVVGRSLVFAEVVGLLFWWSATFAQLLSQRE